MVRSHGGEVVWTRISPASIMRAADAAEVAMAGGEDGGCLFPEFMAAFDAVMSVAKLLELTARLDTTLADVVDALPETHVARLEVPVPWEVKGTVMRRLLERFEGNQVLTIDGMKVSRDGEWALVVPHPLEPVVRVWAEAETDEGAASLAQEFADLVTEVRR
jgi:mannose-1-phosphate guanylyltransferase/phosphomannomutase